MTAQSLTMQLLCNTEEAMPAKLFHCFKACNQAPRTWAHKQAFYQFKNEYLQKYAMFNDYDLQRVEVKCNACDGKGNFTKYYWEINDTQTARCWFCNKGVYAVYFVALKRWLLNGNLFHQPMGRVNENGVRVTLSGVEASAHDTSWYTSSIIYRNKITGYITHPSLKVNPTFPYMVLMYKYNRTEFNRVIQAEYQWAQTRAKHRLNELLRKSKSTLRAYASYFEIGEADIEKYVDEMEVTF